MTRREEWQDPDIQVLVKDLLQKIYEAYLHHQTLPQRVKRKGPPSVFASKGSPRSDRVG